MNSRRVHTAMARYLGIDFGTKRIGIAIGDDQTRLAVPLKQIDHNGDDLSVSEQISNLAAEEEIAAVVVGMPLHMDGTASPQTARTQAFVAVLTSVLAVPTHLFDERLTSATADSKLADRQLTKNQRKARRDALAAQVILQDFLDAS